MSKPELYIYSTLGEFKLRDIIAPHEVGDNILIWDTGKRFSVNAEGTQAHQYYAKNPDERLGAHCIKW